jgi:hypothetical protein
LFVSSTAHSLIDVGVDLKPFQDIFINLRISVIFQVLTAANMKMTVFWVVALSILVKLSDVSEVLAASIFRAMMSTRNNPEHSHLENFCVHISPLVNAQA